MINNERDQRRLFCLEVKTAWRISSHQGWNMTNRISFARQQCWVSLVWCLKPIIGLGSTEKHKIDFPQSLTRGLSHSLIVSSSLQLSLNTVCTFLRAWDRFLSFFGQCQINHFSCRRFNRTLSKTGWIARYGFEVGLIFAQIAAPTHCMQYMVLCVFIEIDHNLSYFF